MIGCISALTLVTQSLFFSSMAVDRHSGKYFRAYKMPLTNVLLESQQSSTWIILCCFITDGRSEFAAEQTAAHCLPSRKGGAGSTACTRQIWGHQHPNRKEHAEVFADGLANGLDTLHQHTEGVTPWRLVGSVQVHFFTMLSENHIWHCFYNQAMSWKYNADEIYSVVHLLQLDVNMNCMTLQNEFDSCLFYSGHIFGQLARSPLHSLMHRNVYMSWEDLRLYWLPLCLSCPFNP